VNPDFTGYSIIRIDPATKKTEPFLSTRATQQEMENGTTAGPRRPVEAKFSPDGNALYIVDIGVIGFTVAGTGRFQLRFPEQALFGGLQNKEITLMFPQGIYHLCLRRQNKIVLNAI
jgi:hypothetical protein